MNIKNKIDIFNNPDLLFNNYKEYLKKIKKYIRKSKPNYLTNYEIDDFISNFKHIIPNKDLYEKIKKELRYFIIGSNLVLENDGIIFVNSGTILNVVISDNKLEIYYIDENSYEKREFVLTDKDKYYYKKKTYNVNMHQYVSQNSTVYDIETKNEIKTFDKNGYQTFDYEEEKRDNFYINNKTKEKRLKEPWPWENFTEKNYAWRTSNGTIIKKRTINYLHENMIENNREDYLINENILPCSKNLCLGGRYIWFDKKLYQMYLNKECDSNYIFQNRGKVYEKK